MTDHHANRPEVNEERGFSTFVLVGSRDEVPSFGGVTVSQGRGELTSRFDIPSHAVEAAVKAVTGDSSSRYAAVLTGEFAPGTLKGLIDRLRAMAAMVQPGQVVVSLSTQEVVRTALQDNFEFHAIGSVELVPGQIERLFLLQSEELRGGSIRTRTPISGRRVTAFIGRSREVDEVRRLLDLSRIVTLVGPSGIGKTSFLQRLAAELEPEFSDGVSMLELSGVTQSSLVGPTLVRLSGAAKLPGEDHIDALIAHLRPRQSILMFDNADSVLPELRRYVSVLADACPNLAILTGSHRALRVAGEARYLLRGMETPAYAEDWRAIAEYDAVSLFVDRAQLVDPSFQLDQNNAPAVAALCQRLDGIPLAIELAASKTRTLSPWQILNRLDDRFLLLKDSDESRPSRHQTLELTVAWGYQHLRPEAQILFRRLSVFQGAFTIDQAIEVCGGAGLDQSLIFAAFEELVDASMLAVAGVSGPEKRFILSETIRLFARDRLKEHQEESAYSTRHRDWCAEFGREASAGLTGPHQLQWLDRLDATYDDIRHVIERNTIRGSDGDLAVRLLLAIYPFYLLRLYLKEGLRVVDKISKATVCAKSPEFPRVLNLGAHLSTMLADRESAREYAMRAIVRARAANDSVGLTRARATLGHIAGDEGKLARSVRHYLAAMQGFRQQGDRTRLLRCLISLAVAEPGIGRVESARAHLDEAWSLMSPDEEPVIRAYYHQNAAHVSLIERRPGEALRHLRECLPIFIDAKEFNGVATCMRNAAYAFEMLGAPKLSARFVGAGSQVAAKLERHTRDFEEATLDELVERLTEVLGVDACDFEIFLGKQMEMEDILGLLLG